MYLILFIKIADEYAQKIHALAAFLFLEFGMFVSLFLSFKVSMFLISTRGLERLIASDSSILQSCARNTVFLTIANDHYLTILYNLNAISRWADEAIADTRSGIIALYILLVQDTECIAQTSHLVLRQICLEGVE